MSGPRRVQFVISGHFIFLLLLAGGFIWGGYYVYTHQPPPPRPQSPPYYVNRASTALKPCYRCTTADGKLQDPQQWKLGKPVEIPAGEQWWFAPVEDIPNPVKIDGVPMLAVHPAANKDKPWFGFDQRKVLLVVFQDIEGRFSIDHPVPPPSPPTPASASPAADSTQAPAEQPTTPKESQP